MINGIFSFSNLFQETNRRRVRFSLEETITTWCEEKTKSMTGIKRRKEFNLDYETLWTANFYTETVSGPEISVWNERNIIFEISLQGTNERRNIHFLSEDGEDHSKPILEGPI